MNQKCKSHIIAKQTNLIISSGFVFVTLIWLFLMGKGYCEEEGCGGGGGGGISWVKNMLHYAANTTSPKKKKKVCINKYQVFSPVLCLTGSLSHWFFVSLVLCLVLQDAAWGRTVPEMWRSHCTQVSYSPAGLRTITATFCVFFSYFKIYLRSLWILVSKKIAKFTCDPCGF